ncbi:MAG TPA: phytanoyl-CoA dioxygenase family protein [Pyrinomonadaceae bacterium]|nr:phytanoyl-CoA dioxygenase family protein [Pyrinomonadaceae bacterium]
MSAVLTPSQLETFRRKGFLTLRGLFGEEEVAGWSRECKRLLGLGLAHKDNIRTRPFFVTETFWLVDRLDPVLDISDLFRALARDERVAGPPRDLLGDEALLFKDRLIYKMVGMPGYPLHQDYSWWQEFPRDLINVAVAIDPADSENGALELFPGYHDRLLSAPGEMRHMNEEEARQVDPDSGELMATEPGDVIIFDCMTPHRSGPNISNRMRRQLYLTYSAAGHGDLYQRQLELMKEGRSSWKLTDERKARVFFR